MAPARDAEDAPSNSGGGSILRRFLWEHQHRKPAALSATEAGIRIAKANTEATRLNLEFTRILAPISGRIGRQLIDPGNFVKADETLLAVIVNQDPIHISFDVDERILLRLMRAMRDGAKVGKVFVDIGLSDDKNFPHKGVVDFVDNQVDSTTGCLRLRAVMANKDALIKPGMSVRIRLKVSPPHKAILIPGQAVMVEEEERFVFVVNDRNVLETRSVKIGQEIDGLRTIETGLNTEDQVVIGGHGRLRPGMKVQPRLEVLPEKQSSIFLNDVRRSTGSLARGSSGPSILVETVYPGVGASVVSEKVRWPIEEMLGAIEGLRYIRSRCTCDGKLAIVLDFHQDVDLPRLQVLTQNRINLAIAQLPDAVKKTGVNITQGTSGVLMIVNLFSLDGRYEPLYLSNYAKINLQDQLARLAGVGEVQMIGQEQFTLRVLLNPEKLADRKLNADEVTKLVTKEIDSGEVNHDSLGNLILKVGGEGQMIRLRDVANVELGSFQRQADVIFDGKPSVPLVIYPTVGAKVQEMRTMLRSRLGELRGRLPQGLALEETFVFIENEDYLLIDLNLPITVVADQTRKVLGRCDELLRLVPGIEHVLALSQNPFDLFGSNPCLLIRLTPTEQRKITHGKIMDSIRKQLEGIEGLSFRIRDLSQPSPSNFRYPIDLALSGPELKLVRAWASELGEQLEKNRKLTDVWVNCDANLRTYWIANVDREAAVVRDISLTEIKNALQLFLGPNHVGDFDRFGRKWRVEIQADTGLGDWVTTLQQVKIRNSRGQMIPINTVLELREASQPLALHFLDYRPMIEITANPALGVSSEQARKSCEAVAEQIRQDLGLGAGYRLTWLQGK